MTNDCQLYLITPPSIDQLDHFAEQVRAAFDQGNIAALQLRLKGVAEDEIKQASSMLLPICDHYNIAFIMNDDVELAKSVGADGVHFGQEDMKEVRAIRYAREQLGQEAIIGVSCYDSKDLAMAAGEKGADYVSFGAFFPSPTKESPGKPHPDLLTWWNSWTTIPSCAIGGITPQNCRPLVETGVSFLAVISAIWQHPESPEAAVKEFNAVIGKS